MSPLPLVSIKALVELLTGDSVEVYRGVCVCDTR